MTTKKTRCCMVWLTLFVLAITSLLIGDACTFTDENGVLRDSPLLLVGAMLAATASVVLVLDVLLMLTQKNHE